MVDSSKASDDTCGAVAVMQASMAAAIVTMTGKLHVGAQALANDGDKLAERLDVILQCTGFTAGTFLTGVASDSANKMHYLAGGLGWQAAVVE